MYQMNICWKYQKDQSHQFYRLFQVTITVSFFFDLETTGLGIYSYKIIYCMFTLFCTLNCITFNIDNFNSYFIQNRSVGLYVRIHNIQQICFTNLCHISICHSCDRPLCCHRTTLLP